MYKQSFQGCPFITLLEAKGAQPLKDWDTRGSTSQRLYNKDVKTYVIDVAGQQGKSIKLPKDNQALGITQQYLAFQMFLPRDQPFTLTLTCETASKSKIRLVFSTSIKHAKISTLHARIPLHIIAGTWTTVIFDLVELCRSFPHQEFSTLHTIEIQPFATFLKIFTLLNCPLPTLELYSELDLQDHVRNPRLPPFPFSRRVHKPLDQKLQSVPMHVQILDTFYLSLFDENKTHHDIVVRDFAQIVEVRRVFMPDFNIQGNQVQTLSGVGIGVSEAFGAQEDLINQVYSEEESRLARQKQIQTQQKMTKFQLEQQKREREINERREQRQLNKESRAVAALQKLQLQHNQVEQQKLQIDNQMQQYRERNLRQDIHSQELARKQEALELMEQRRQEHLRHISQQQSEDHKQQRQSVPQVLQNKMQDDDEDFCAEGIDLTLNAIPVQIQTQKCSQGQQDANRAPSPVVPSRDQKVGLVTDDKTPKPLKRSTIEDQQYNKDRYDNSDQMEEPPFSQNISVDVKTQSAQSIPDIEIQQKKNTPRKNLTSRSSDRQISSVGLKEEIQETKQELDQLVKENQSENYDEEKIIRSPEAKFQQMLKIQKEEFEDNNQRSVSPSEDKNFVTAVKMNQDILPSPSQIMQAQAESIPGPADVMEDPIALGLVYDPVTGCYYEADDD